MNIATAVSGPRSGMAFVTTPPHTSALDPRRPGPGVLLYHFTRLQLPGVRFAEPKFLAHLERSFRIFLPKNPAPVTWTAFLEGLYAVDWAVCVGCLEGQNAAWEVLFNARTGRSDCLLVDALRARAVRLYPRNEERQETAVTEFWSNLIAPETRGPLPVLARYDGHRPLAPWLIRVFQNWHLSKLRGRSGVSALPDEDVAMPMEPVATDDPVGRWHEVVRPGGPRLARLDRRRGAAAARPALALPDEPARSGEALRAERGDTDAPHRQAPRPGAGADRPAARRRGLDRRRPRRLRADRTRRHPDRRPAPLRRPPRPPPRRPRQDVGGRGFVKQPSDRFGRSLGCSGSLTDYFRIARRSSSTSLLRRSSRFRISSCETWPGLALMVPGRISTRRSISTPPPFLLDVSLCFSVLNLASLLMIGVAGFLVEDSLQFADQFLDLLRAHLLVGAGPAVAERTMVPFGPSTPVALSVKPSPSFSSRMLDVVSDHHCPTAFELRQLEMIGLELQRLLQLDLGQLLSFDLSTA